LPELCATTCQLHSDTRKQLDSHDVILNGERGNPGIVGKLDNVAQTVADIKSLLKWAIGLIVAPVILAIIALVVRTIK
jgi:hypothetical protein